MVAASFLLGLAVATSAPPACAIVDFEMGPGGTVVHVRLTERLSSQDAQSGQKFGFETTAPVTIAGKVVPSGTPGDGVVAFAESARGRRPGRMRLRVVDLRPAGRAPIAVRLPDDEAGTVSAADTRGRSGLSIPAGGTTIVVGGITADSNVIYEKGRSFAVLVPDAQTSPEPAPAPSPS